MTMAVKFKVGFTMSAETLFGIIAKVLPIEDLSVEEIETPPQISKIAAQVARLAAPTNPRGRPPQRANRYNGSMLDGGVNKIILTALEDGAPHRYGELKKAVAAAGYAGSGIGSKLSRLRELHAVHQPEIGVWQIGEAKKRAATG
jgi:hypothetical protein